MMTFCVIGQMHLWLATDIFDYRTLEEFVNPPKQTRSMRLWGRFAGYRHRLKADGCRAGREAHGRRSDPPQKPLQPASGLLRRLGFKPQAVVI
jgi:hypothetical protein